MEDRSHICTVCGNGNGRHFHIVDWAERVTRASPEDRSHDPVKRIDTARLHIPPDDLVWVCDDCVMIYKVSHPDFVPGLKDL